ncbi:MAG TPA: protein kinase, partial [Polyangiaceae bacterium]
MATQLTIAGAPVRWVEPLGHGASSSVWLGECQGAPCVLKLGKAPADAPRFADEAERLLFAAAPEFPALLGVGLVGPALAAELGPSRAGSLAELRPELGAPYLLLSWAPGVPLDATLADAALSQTAREQLALAVARDLGAALSALHGSGAAHGDVKPANVIVATETLLGQVQYRARLVDFGLSGSAQLAQPLGGTRRYLAPEVFSGRGGDARARDLWAFGATLLEIVAPAAAEAAIADIELSSESALSGVIQALLARAPGARPSASWVLRRALSSVDSAPELHAEARRRASVRRAYLTTRQSELFAAARSKSMQLELRGPSAEWLKESRAHAESILKLRGLAMQDGEARTLGPLDAAARARFLVALVGPAAAAWPALRELDEAQLIGRLLELAEHGEPESFTLAAIERGAVAELDVAHASAVDVALSLRSPSPDPRWLDRGESLVLRDKGPLGLALALARAYRLRGELGRALSLLGGFPDPEARVASAELCRRARDSESARAILDMLGDEALSAEQRERVAAIRARIALDSGDLVTAGALLAPFESGVQSLEARALLELASGRSGAAFEAATRARLHAASDEERARAEGVLGLLAHAA